MEFYAKVFQEAAVPSEIMSVVREITRGMGQYALPVDVAGVIDEGDTIGFASASWQVLHTPGHAAGLICLYEPLHRVLLSSDHLLADISSNPVVEPPPPGQSIRLRSLAAYRISLKRVASMEISLALPSHGPPIPNVPDLVNRRLAFHDRRLEKIRAVLQSGARTTWEITQFLFPDRTPLDTFLALSETLGHLELLELEGQIDSMRRGKILLWNKATGHHPD
jgi:glyoxylase-like metal-dependent hydrolase (beta-lactamase superfamily II)